MTQRVRILLFISMINYIYYTIFTMKNLKLVSLLALTVLFLFLGGCQKDDVDYRNSTKNLYQSDEKYSNSKYISVSEI